MTEQTPPLPHVEKTVRAIAELHTDHHRNASPLLRTLRSVANKLGRPMAVAVYGITIVGWITLNTVPARFGYPVLDYPPFHVLEIVLTVMTVSLTLIILAAQQHESELSENRVQLTLELAILSEQKMAKLIDMLDALRRDMPNVQTHDDPTVRAFAKSGDAKSIIDNLENSRRVAQSEIDAEP